MLRKQVEVLSLENNQLQHLKMESQLHRQENDNLKKITRAMTEINTDSFTVRILAYPVDHLISGLVIENNNLLNLQKNQVVLGVDGLIGRVDKISVAFARVMTITDGRSRIPAYNKSTGEQVILKGTNTLELEVLHSSQYYVSFKEGDILLTSGVGGVYIPGLPVARITYAKGQTIKAQPVDSIFFTKQQNTPAAKTNNNYFVRILKVVVPIDDTIDNSTP